MTLKNGEIFSIQDISFQIVFNEKKSQIIYLTGIVRSFDVTAANTVDSGNILNAQIAYTGKGAISDKQKPGWLMRILDNTWPF